MSKNLSKILSNENISVVFKTKLELKCQSNYISGNTNFYVFITEKFWQDFWCNNWWSIFDVVERLCLYPLINYPNIYQTVDTKIVKQIPLMTSNDLIGIIGGTLGLFLGFSFFGCISVMLDYLGLLVTRVTKSQVPDSASGGKENVRNPDFEMYRTSGFGRDVRTSPI